MDLALKLGNHQRLGFFKILQEVWPTPDAENLALRTSIIGPLLLLSDRGSIAFEEWADQASAATRDGECVLLAKALKDGLAKHSCSKDSFCALDDKRITF